MHPTPTQFKIEDYWRASGASETVSGDVIGSSRYMCVYMFGTSKFAYSAFVGYAIR